MNYNRHKEDDNKPDLSTSQIVAHEQQLIYWKIGDILWNPPLLMLKETMLHDQGRLLLYEKNKN